MTTDSPDVLVEVMPGLTLFRLHGTWRWQQDSRMTGRVLTPEDVVRELQSQVERMHLKTGLMVDALHALTHGKPPTQP